MPAEHRSVFRGRGALLRSHRGWDLGALELARRFGAPLFFATTTRLLVDLNRSIGNRSLFSELTRPLPAGAKRRILERHYLPYRVRATEAIERAAPALHLSVHTFAPVMRGERRAMDVGLLYDPARAGERELCLRWRAALAKEGLAVRCNAPYRGTSDGFATWLRRVFPERRYLGVELEVNQKHPRRGGRAWANLQATIVRTLPVETAPAPLH